MKNIPFSFMFAVILCCLDAGGGQDGFVVWSEGDNCDNELRFCALKDGVLGPSRTAVKKGISVDVLVQISYDGAWLVWCRATKIFSSRYGKCGYDASQNFDIYVAKINNGATLPAKAIRVDQGSWPAWAMDENAKDPAKPKLLYYSRQSDSTIRKATINPDGTILEKNSVYVKHPQRVFASRPHAAISPNGRYVASYSGRNNIFDLEKKSVVLGTKLAGYHPCWGPRSKYIVHSQNGVTAIMDGQVIMPRKPAGVGKYWQGVSNDAYYDQGKLWIIGRFGGRGRNGGGIIEFKEVDITGDGWKYGEPTKVSLNGTSCDIHIHYPEAGTISGLSWRLADTPNFKATIRGSRLDIESKDISIVSAKLYNLLGINVAQAKLTGGSRNSIPLHTISNGKYILKINGNATSYQKKVLISKQ